jgi:protein ImuB
LSVQQKDRRLVAFFLHGKRFAVHETYGPWRKSGEWWSQQIWSHEEWDVLAKTQTEDTLLCVITHDLLHHHWQLDALYD